jgi:hypothetical protein
MHKFVPDRSANFLFHNNTRRAKLTNQIDFQSLMALEGEAKQKSIKKRMNFHHWLHNCGTTAFTKLKILELQHARKIIISCCGKTKCSITATRKSKNLKSSNRSLAITPDYSQTTSTAKGVLQNQRLPTSINATTIALETTAKLYENGKYSILQFC